MTAHTAAMNARIWFEVSAAALLMLAIVTRAIIMIVKAGRPATVITLVAAALVVASLAGAQPAGPRVPRPAPLPADAQRLVDQWEQEQENVVSQLRFIQQSSRDNGRAEEAAAIASEVRMLLRRAVVVGQSAAELVNEGLPNKDEPVLMSLFRNRAGETLSFSVRGRDDQQVWGTSTYTDTSALETAVVHAGLLRPGQRAIVKVRVLPGQEHYDASNHNGVQSSASERAAGSFRFAAANIATPVRTSELSSFRDLVGQSVTLPIVGAPSDRLWGTGIYTDDSSVAAAAVHAGVLAPGEFGYVKVTLLPGQSRYESSTQNGIGSQPFGEWEGSFRVERGQDSPVQLPRGEDASRIVPLAALRTVTGANFVVQVVGAGTGPLWGAGPYTDDSSIGVAAVHAGLLKPGEIGFVRVRIDGGHDRYAESERNGVRSQPYGPWEGSFRLERVEK